MHACLRPAGASTGDVPSLPLLSGNGSAGLLSGVSGGELEWRQAEVSLMDKKMVLQPLSFCTTKVIGQTENSSWLKVYISVNE